MSSVFRILYRFDIGLETPFQKTKSKVVPESLVDPCHPVIQITTILLWILYRFDIGLKDPMQNLKSETHRSESESSHPGIQAT